MRNLRFGIIASLALFVIASIAGAQEPPRPGAVTEESLGRMLRTMGLEPKLDKQRYDFKFEATHNEQSWNLSMSAVLSANGKSLWLMAWLDPLPRSASDVPRTALLRLLADNDRLGKGKFFAYIPANRRFVLQRVMPNEGMTSASLRDALQDLGGSVADTYSHWSVDNWRAKTASEPRSTTDGKPVRSASSDSDFRPTSRN